MTEAERSVATANALIAVLISQRNEAMDRFTDSQAELIVTRQECDTLKKKLAALETPAGE